MKPQYKDKTFKTKEEFEQWLDQKTKYIIEFEDLGQDFLFWYLDKNGEVLESKPFQGHIWNGSMVNVLRMNVGDFLTFKNNSEKEMTLNHKVLHIEEK